MTYRATLYCDGVGNKGCHATTSPDVAAARDWRCIRIQPVRPGEIMEWDIELHFCPDCWEIIKAQERTFRDAEAREVPTEERDADAE